jgi:uncharacterized protein (TIGR00299 family) protein
VRILYLDCFSGIAGDMLLGALVDLGVGVEDLRKRLKVLPLRGYGISARKTTRQGITGIKFDVKVSGKHRHRGWKEIREIVGKADLPVAISQPALKIFRRLIEAEARIHRIPINRVHLHEVGAVDAIVDIVGSVMALHDLLGANGRLHVSPLHLGGGKVTMAHGTFPVPAPATVALLKGVPVVAGPVDGELVTPTGAAIVSTLATAFGPMPSLTLEDVGYGAGSRQYEGHPNMLRAILGESRSAPETLEEVVVVESNIDDMSPQAYGHLMDRLFASGALEVFYTPIQMKKNRPGTLVTIITPQERFGDVTGTLFRESTTIGLRHQTVDRMELAREVTTVRTSLGRVRVKISSLGGVPTQAQPEYEDCRKIASAKEIPLKEVQAEALAAFRSGLHGDALGRRSSTSARKTTPAKKAKKRSRS